MKAAKWYGKGDIRIEAVDEPEAGRGEVKVAVAACGISGSDLHEFTSGPFIIPRRPHPLTGRAGGPVILGHELSGRVVEVGQGVTRVQPGDRVVMNPLIYCGQCHYCRRGVHIMCTKLGTYGFAADGGFAEYGVFAEDSVVKLPDAVTDEGGAFVEPLSVAVHAVRRSRMGIGDWVGVIGAGPIGLLVTQAALASGAGRVFVVEPMGSRREMAGKVGAYGVCDPSAVDAGKEIAHLTEGLRADVVFDCVGSQSSFDTAVRVAGRRGRICVVGLALKPIEVPFLRLWGHEKEVVFSSGYEDEFPTAIGYLADGRVEVEPLISERIALEELVDKGITRLIDEPENYIKVLVYPQEKG